MARAQSVAPLSERMLRKAGTWKNDRKASAIGRFKSLLEPDCNRAVLISSRAALSYVWPGPGALSKSVTIGVI